MKRLLVVLLTVAVPAAGHAGPLTFIKKALGIAKPAQPFQRLRKAPPAHLVTEHLYNKLKQPIQANYWSSVHYGDADSTGSGVVVGVWQAQRADRYRALVLTNHHVVDGNRGQQPVLSFVDGVQAETHHVVAKSRFLDYALLEVELPSTSQVVPSAPSIDMAAFGHPVYAIGAATSLAHYQPRQFFSGTAQEHDEIDHAIADGHYEHPTISFGRVMASAPEYGHTSGGDTKVRRAFLQDHDYASAPGASGGGVYSSATHMLLGINAAGSRTAETNFSGAVPFRLIAHDLWKKMSRKRIAMRHQDVVGTLLEQVIPPETLAGGSTTAPTP